MVYSAPAPQSSARMTVSRAKCFCCRVYTRQRPALTVGVPGVKELMDVEFRVGAGFLIRGHLS